MDMYTPEGDVDLGEALERLKSTRGMTSESARRATVAEVTAAALIDIAASLRPLAIEASAALASSIDRMVAEADVAEEEPEAPTSLEPAVGYRARPRHDDGVGIVREVGESEGRTWVRVSWLPDPRDTDTTYPEILAAVSEKLWADGLYFDMFPEGSEIVKHLPAAVGEAEPIEPDEDDVEDEGAFTPPPTGGKSKKGKGKK